MLLIQKTTYLSALGRPYTIFKKPQALILYILASLAFILCMVCIIKENIILYYVLNNILLLI